MTSPVDTSVKYFHSGMSGAPVLMGSPGSLIDVLDACLVNGFGLKAVDSLVVASNVATIAVASGIVVAIDSVVLITGAIPAALNGEQKITTINNPNSISFSTTGISDQTATGTIAVKLAPAGWEKAFSGTYKSAYRSLDGLSTGSLLRVDDTSTKNARVVGYETMSSIDTGSGPFPTEIQLNGGGWISKSESADATSREWSVISDGRLFFVSTRPAMGSNYDQQLKVFGDFNSVKLSGDSFACMLLTSIGDASSGNHYGDSLLTYAASTSSSCFVAKSYTGLGSSALLTRSFSGVSLVVEGASSGDVGSLAYPNPVDGGIYISQIHLREFLVNAYRGDVPGAYAVPQKIPVGTFSSGQIIKDVAGIPGRSLLFLGGGSPYYTHNVTLIDLTGPWR